MTGAAVLRAGGQWAVFTGQVLATLPVTVRHYRRQIVQAMNGLAWGRGSLLVDGGVISVLLILGLAMGASLAIESFSTLNMIGFGPLAGIVGGVANVRELAPLMTGIAFATQAGCRMTAEIGSMRIAEEIDATEAMGLRPIPFVVGSRLLGALACLIPGYFVVLIASFVIADTVITVFRAQPAGTYQHYFVQFLTPTDIGFSLLKAAVFCALVTVIHCYYGYFADGGPVGVGQASGRAVRASLVAIVVVNFTLTVSIWGLRPEFVFTG
ncbi:ABC transporter permease [Mycolicibacillus parakoreensis]|uniref:ABC transporter permease n=1 Tax=Mycolicibacillus parakoreensis TaxID=1069221 RepID=A0ABY3TYL1_9MYCO|nr:ABC transporter permease [Mycolicibacillus parakoreensis]MCV7316538.1 ABC transporter permease [Mycolicibacillus parakoreensis]ULN52763.1 ABC transporter permease [Mycolicibacillus parakoreensis]HLR98361.1 ABC transporter permease [Mycolicibacillus parakoreensis]